MLVSAWDSRIIAHTSGSMTSDVLSPLADLGAVASLHPVQSFRKIADGPTPIKNIYFSVEGNPVAVRKLSSMVRELQAKPVQISADDKSVYHLACSVASNFLVTLMRMSFDMLRSAGFKEDQLFEIIEPLLATTLDNVKVNGPEKALTGPISRGDTETIKSHLNVLNQKFPEYLSSYIELANATVQLSLNDCRISENQAQKIIQMLIEYTKSKF